MKTSMPRAIAALASARGMAEPPTTIFIFERSTSLLAGAASSICRIVGTQCEKVTPSRAINPSRTSDAEGPG